VHQLDLIPGGPPSPPPKLRPYVVTVTSPAMCPFDVALTAADLVRYEHESFHAPALELSFLPEGYYPAEQLGEPDLE